MAKLSVDKALLKAKSHAKNGAVKEAQKLYQAVLRAFPQNKSSFPEPSIATNMFGLKHCQFAPVKLRSIKKYAPPYGKPRKVTSQRRATGLPLLLSGHFPAQIPLPKALNDLLPNGVIYTFVSPDFNQLLKNTSIRPGKPSRQCRPGRPSRPPGPRGGVLV